MKSQLGLAYRLSNSSSGVPLDLAVRLSTALAGGRIVYCHWKSNLFLDRAASGERDLDLLVHRNHAQHFTQVLCGLGFKEALPPEHDRLPGVQHYYGYDQSSGRLLHVHAHFQLILGSDLFKNYRLPMEQAYLESCVQGDLFRVPAPEFELVIFVIRMVLKHSTWDSILMRHGLLTSSERGELDHLLTQDTLAKLDEGLRKLRVLDRRLFSLCLQSLQPGCSLWARVWAGDQLQRALEPCARHSGWFGILMKLARRIWPSIQRRGFGYVPKARFAHGGLFIAIAGGDGAGKTTMIDECVAWLGEEFEVVRMHMGKPSWSRTTTLIRGILKVGTLLGLYPFEGDAYEESPGPHAYPWFIRAVCTARDRYLTYVRARRVSSNGGVVLCDRYSLPGFLEMDGPQCRRAMMVSHTPNRVHQYLARMEES